MRTSMFSPSTLFLLSFAAITLVYAVAGKSIIRELIENTPQFMPDGKLASRPGRQPEDIPIENCRITQHNKELSGKLDRLCDECFQTYRVANFYVSCRAGCFNNDIFRGCAMAMFRQALVQDLENFVKTEEASVAKTTTPTGKTTANFKKLDSLIPSENDYNLVVMRQ
ncbi:crustacean hyperglycemic hormones-like [Paramacrobiotus metropolitanus]|uniref:crustacean hyperglycemic hormones-like n=1 Tax=Paramacrobiotus metropolitanus TaxID=2943436 RepID=UPI002445A36D|nr:crustacean hyperglycemic hormones-like [Paramacrobiotus metropolitanus]XP_055331401.1 crustacean hyperglycemic hormones-like [Paramacrobiotus metropolitanus]XP_055331402.1 crustacean hyperglycemic hormones-like [Paramacrobiotus metropolitanus]